ncbi:hypothetical protein GCM10008922_19620 [Faecalicatena contorta]|uniref:hypothetical protein n=1 Tax=Faecalicatena contorta TaxID=39482 RepID=UPI0031DFF563
MKQVVAAVAGKLPRQLKNFHLIKRQDIYIPFCEIGITCLTKEVTEINLFFETILKLIDIEVSDVYEISSIMGVEFKLLKETIVDMIEQKYIITSENKLIMTPRGKKALADRELVTIRKKNLNELSVNMITGSIEESGKNIIEHPSKREVCLSQEQTITKDFLESNYPAINEIYQRNQIEANVFNTRVLQRELYKILDIAYDKLYFVKDELLIYKNDESEDYEFIIKGDIGEKYQNSFYSQVRDVVFPGMENFFERNRNFAQAHYDKRINNQDNRKYTKDLIGKLSGTEIISDKLLDEYMHTRALIDQTELEVLFSYNKEFDYEGIIISCERLEKFLTSGMVSALDQVTKKKIWVLYDEKEYNIEKIIEQRFGDKIKKKEVSVSKRKEEKEQFVCFYPNILVEFVEKTEKVFDRPITVFEGRIEFDSDVIKSKLANIIKDYEISFSLLKPKSPKKGQQKYNKTEKRDTAQPSKKYKYKKEK